MSAQINGNNNDHIADGVGRGVSASPWHTIDFDLLADLDLAVLQHLDNSTFKSIKVLPDWFSRSFPETAENGGSFEVGAQFTFPPDFLREAHRLWTKKTVGWVQSDWALTDALGDRIHMKATALCHPDRRVVLVEHLYRRRGVVRDSARGKGSRRNKQHSNGNGNGIATLTVPPYVEPKDRRNALVGKSEAIHFVHQRIREVAPRESTVLIEGDTGTGKELVARAIHTLSPRKNMTFQAVNCAALTESVLTSQLFGHKRGAFTGAVSDQIGLCEAAKGGTLFLDEIGDIPQSIQASLLRAVEEKEITRLGEYQTRHIDVRVVVATNRNLADEVANGNFRSDLLYRIRVGTIHLPPLAERREDIPLLIRWFLSHCPGAGRVEDVDSTALCVLLDYPWAGNVRELKSVIEYAVGRCSGSVIQVEHLPPEVIGSRKSPSIPNCCLDNPAGRLQAALKLSEGNRSLAAKLLGMSRSTFYRQMDRYGIEE